VIKTKTGNVKGVKPGGIVGSEFLEPGKTDPYQWVNSVLLPALAKKGVTDPAKIQEVIAAIASQTTTAQMMSIFATQQSRITKDAALVHGASGIEAADTFQKNDPKVIAKSIHSQFDNLLSNTAEPMMPAANAGMNWFASGLSWAAEHAKEKPGHTAAAGTWGASLLSALGVEGGMATAGHFGFGPGSKFLLSKIVGAMAPMLAITQLASDSVSDDDLARLRRYEAGPRSRFDRLHDLDRVDDMMPNVRRESFIGQKVAAIRAEHDAERARLESELEGFGYNPAITSGRYQGQGAPNWTIDDIRKATGLGSNGEPVKAVVEGNATLDANITIKTEPGFWAQIDQKISNAINAFRSSNAPATGTAGSTGRSMPEAVAGP
jgi:hypothetical protein